MPVWPLVVGLLEEVPDGLPPADYDDFNDRVVAARDVLLGGGLDVFSGLVPPAIASELTALALPAPGSPLSGHAALAVATALDEIMNLRFAEQWLAGHTETFDLHPGDWYPVPEQRRLGHLPPTSRPESLGIRPGETAHVRRYDGPVGVTVDAGFADQIDDLCGSLERVATLSPAPGSAAPPVALTDLAAAAFADGASVVVAPELAAEGLDLDALWPGVPPDTLFIPGTQRKLMEGLRVNRVSLAFGSEVAALGRYRTVAFHDKFSPFVVEGTSEDITPRLPHITVLAGLRYRAVALVCKDLLSLDVVLTVARLGVTLLLVPAHSEKVDGFVAAAGFLASHAQTVTVCANGPAGGDKVGGILGRPVRGGTIATHAAIDRPGYALWMLDRPWSAVDAPHNPRVKHM